MNITDQEIQEFEKALQGPAPQWDPGWKLSKLMIDTIRVQAAEMLRMQAKLSVYEAATASTQAILCNALRNVKAAQVANSGISEQQAAEAISNLNQAIQAAQKGQEVAKYAGAVLKFMAKALV